MLLQSLIHFLYLPIPKQLYILFIYQTLIQDRQLSLYYYYLYIYSANSFVEENRISYVVISSSSFSFSSFTSTFSPYRSYIPSLIFFNFNSLINIPVILVSSHAIISALQSALSYLIDQSCRLPILLNSLITYRCWTYSQRSLRNRFLTNINVILKLEPTNTGQFDNPINLSNHN